MAYELAVWLYGRHVATVREQRTGKFRLDHTDSAFDLGQVGRPLLSVAMPLIPGRHYSHGVVGPFLEGLLPEGEARTRLESYYDVRRGDVRALLEAIGRDCAGAVQFLAPDAAHEAPPGHPEAMTTAELDRLVLTLPERPLGDDDRVRVSLAGQQSKLLLVLRPDGGWARPLDGYPSTHILKPGDDRFPGMVHNEAFCLHVARELGLTSIDVDLVPTATGPALVVSRYDRRTDEGTVRRVHQEDLCQALSIDSGPGGDGKYEEYGGPRLADVGRVLDVHNGDTEQTRLLTRVAAFTVVVGNADAHGKNLSLLHPRGEPIRLAPLYDVVSTIHYRNVGTGPARRAVSTSLAMSINGVTDIHAVTREDLVAESRTWHHAADSAPVVDDLLARLPEAVARAARAVPDSDGTLVETMLRRARNLVVGAPAGG